MVQRFIEIVKMNEVKQYYSKIVFSNMNDGLPENRIETVLNWYNKL